MYTAIERAQILHKWLRSFFRTEWRFEDYPVGVRTNDVDDPACAWIAQFLNWPGPIGLGADPEAARADLRKKFGEIVQERNSDGEPMPRPGAREPIRFAESTRVNADADLLADFLERVLGFDRRDVFVSDLSSLHDFGDEREVERYRALIRSNYGIETADLEDALLADILERIARKS